jgi:hypothetical protein
MAIANSNACLPLSHITRIGNLNEIVFLRLDKGFVNNIEDVLAFSVSNRQALKVLLLVV